jgi:hypothetical protein
MQHIASLLLMAAAFLTMGMQARRTLTQIEALRIWSNQGQHANVEKAAYSMLWKDIRQPEVLHLLANSLDRMNKKGDAAVYYTLFLRIVDKDSPAEFQRLRQTVERKLKTMGQDSATQEAAYVNAASKQKWDSPDKAADAWMNVAEADIFNLHGLYAWKLVDGRKDAAGDWIHNTQGVMHRSGMKLVSEVEGRKGVLFGVPLKELGSADADEHHRKSLDQLKHNSSLAVKNPLGKKVLRIGTRAYGFPFILKVKDGEKELGRQTVKVEEWSDLKIELTEVPRQVTLDLIVPEGQKWSEGVWIDYVDFYDE